MTNAPMYHFLIALGLNIAQSPSQTRQALCVCVEGDGLNTIMHCSFEGTLQRLFIRMGEFVW